MKGHHMWHRGFPFMVLLVLLQVSSLAAGPSQSLEKVFMQAAKAVEAAARDEHLRRGSLSPYEKAGDVLASRFPDADFEFLKAQAENEEGDSARKLAWMVLAKLASHQKDARDMVSGRAIAGDRLAILAVSFMPEAVRKEVAESLVRQEGYWQGKQDLVELLGFIGDEDSLKALNDLVGRNNERLARPAAIGVLPCLQEKLKQTAAEQQVWSQRGVCCWRAMLEVEEPRLVGPEYVWAAEHVANSGVRCPVSFLKCRIKAGDVLAIVLAGIQKEGELIEDLGVAAESNSVLQRGKALESLVQIGNKDAMDVLSRLMKPGATEENNRIAQVLADMGTESSAGLLERLVRDERYRDSWPAFEEAIKHIRERLKRGR
jgi:HEAT repeat protein